MEGAVIVIIGVCGLVALIAISVLVGVSLDTEDQRRKCQAVADARRALAIERQELREEAERIEAERRRRDLPAPQQRRCRFCPLEWSAVDE
jgi:hypothetical protein